MKKGSRVVNYAQVPVVEHVRRKNLFRAGSPALRFLSTPSAYWKRRAPLMYPSRVTAADFPSGCLLAQPPPRKSLCGHCRRPRVTAVILADPFSLARRFPCASIRRRHADRTERMFQDETMGCSPAARAWKLWFGKRTTTARVRPPSTRGQGSGFGQQGTRAMGTPKRVPIWETRVHNRDGRAANRPKGY